MQICIYKNNDNQPWTDIDVTANVNGLIVMGEVKRSFSGVNAELADQRFMLGEMYRPNIILLAVQALRPQDETVLAPFKELNTKLNAIDVSLYGLLPIMPQDYSIVSEYRFAWAKK